MAGKKKPIIALKKTSVPATKKAAVKKAVLKPVSEKAAKKKNFRSLKEPQIEGEPGSSASAAKQERQVGESKMPTASRTSYEKLVNPQNYNEYMRASKFRGNR